MRAIDFPEANIIFEKPESMTDDQCHEISAYTGVGDDGISYTITVWQPNKEDIDAIVAGRQIYVKMLGAAPAPVVLYTFNEKGEGNF
jgi:hypothetical protein